MADCDPPPAQRIEVKKLAALPGLQPQHDEVFVYLGEQALSGQVEVYFAAVPLHLIEPYDKQYDPRNHPVGRALVDQVSQAWKQGKFPAIWLYPRGEKFILSDDYLAYCAALEGQPDYLPCFVFGKPSQPDVRDVQGPIQPQDVMERLFFS